MGLIFRVETTKKSGARIAVQRSTIVDGKEVRTQVGTYSKRRPAKLMYAKLHEDERHEFETFLNLTVMSEHFFDEDPETMDRMIVKIASKFKTALQSIAEKAWEYGIPFFPEVEMSYAAFNKAKLVEQKLKALGEANLQGLEALGIDIDEPSQPRFIDIETPVLFEKLIDIYGSLDALADAFSKACKKYANKDKSFQGHFFELYADLTDEKKYKYPKWYNGVAVCLLKEKGVDPLTLISVKKLAGHWLRIKKGQYKSVDQALKIFSEYFDLNAKQKSVAKGILKVSI